MVVPRPASRPVRRRDATSSRGTSRTTVDTFECVAWGKRVRTTLLALQPDEHVVVEGALRRRFWRTGAGVASMVEIDVARVRRVPAARGPVRRGSPGRGPAPRDPLQRASVADQASSWPPGQ
ncbi:MAG: single-stranded DNA-binding protein [Actinomycetota bacterium]|nr:single-stranded DNA-binding protein [Actinomycetota bacterium]